MLSVPRHLKDILIVESYVTVERILNGSLCCICGNNNFTLLYPGETIEYQGNIFPCSIEVEGHCIFIIKAICTKCNKEHILFDADFHGWDGVMCHDAKEANLPRPPLVPWKCLSCGNLSHKVIIKIAFEDKEDFIEQSRGEFDENKWPDAFQWIWMSLTCSKCGLETKDWIDYETA